MSDRTTLVFTMLYEEYQNRLKKGMDKGCVYFNKNAFFSKFHYSKNEIDNILLELEEHGLIERWVTGDFALTIEID